jgi:hypothetical protein
MSRWLDSKGETVSRDGLPHNLRESFLLVGIASIYFNRWTISWWCVCVYVRVYAYGTRYTVLVLTLLPTYVLYSEPHDQIPGRRSVPGMSAKTNEWSLLYVRYER